MNAQTLLNRIVEFVVKKYVKKQKLISVYMMDMQNRNSRGKYVGQRYYLFGEVNYLF
jgi:hypothetical protein